MGISRESVEYIETVKGNGIPPFHTLTPDAAREMLRKRDELFAEDAASSINTNDIQIPVRDGSVVEARIYTPSGRSTPGVLVYFHGGGWVIGDLNTSERQCRGLAEEAGCVVVSCDYRLAPEHKFPAAIEDAYDATKWIGEHAHEFGFNSEPLAVGGDSAGGNLAAAVSLKARDQGNNPNVCFQLLVCPILDSAMATESFVTNGSDYLLTSAEMEWFWAQYTSTEADRIEPYASPAHAQSLRDLPDALVITAEFDPLRDEAEAYAHRLRSEGVDATISRYDGAIHGFYGRPHIFKAGSDALRESGRTLKKMLFDRSEIAGLS